MNKASTGFLVATLLLGGCSASRTRLKNAAERGDEIVEAEGLVPYKAGDLPGTKAAALAAAQKSAVELVVGVYVNAKTRVEKAVAIEQTILTRAQGYVKKYNILSEERSGDWFKTRIRALVSTRNLHEDLDHMGLLRQPAVSSPRVVILLQEFVEDKRVDSGRAAQALTQSLLDRGFKVVTVPSLKPDADPTEQAQSLRPAQVDILVSGLGRAESLDSKSLGGMASYRATVSFRVLEAGSGEVLTTVSRTASGLEGTPDIASGKALENAAQLAGRELNNLPQILSDRSHVEVTIHGLKSFGTLADFEKALPAQTGVKEFVLRSFDQSSGVAILDVHTAGIGSQDLADLCVKIGGESWTVLQVLGHSVQLSASIAGH